MHRYFNTEGLCIPGRHYMVDLHDRLERIKSRYVDRGSYFVINRGRQYGKTTTLRALADYLKTEYLVVSMDFQMISTKNFENEVRFSKTFAKMFISSFGHTDVEDLKKLLLPVSDFIRTEENDSLDQLFACISEVCAKASKPIVLLIDEVDQASNHQVFIDFLALLRGYYLNRENMSAFHSVILAGVYDIKNLKLKMRPEEEHKYNSPWNIAAKFNMDMSFSSVQIASMLQEYEKEHHVGMDVENVAEEIFQYTSGYPYLVSNICKRLDEELSESKEFEKKSDVWTDRGVMEAVKNMLNERIPLFESMTRQLTEYPEIKRIIHAVLFEGRRITYNIDNPMISLASMFGYIVNNAGAIQISNRIFEMCLYNLFLSEDELASAISDEAQRDQSQFIQNGRLNMELVLEKFVLYYGDIYRGSDMKFLEEYGRKIFLLYLKPIINGTGNYYIEAQTRDAKRTDVIVDYLGEQFIIELKIWRGSEYHERGERQLTEYLDFYHLKKGYMLSFNFNKNKKTGIHEIQIDNRTILEAVV